MHSGIVVLCALLLSQAAAPTQPTGRIAGRIVADGTNAPIGDARILMRPSAPPRADGRILTLPSAPPRPTAGRGGPFGPGWRPMQAQTDENGRFVIEKVE